MIMNAALESERFFEFAPHVGAMRRIMEKCCLYAESRFQFNRKISDNQGVSHKLADMKIKTELARSYLYKIAAKKDNRKKTFLESAIFKTFVSESYIQICKDAMQIHGAYGYTTEYGLERELRDAVAGTIYSGTNEMQRNTIYNLIR